MARRALKTCLLFENLILTLPLVRGGVAESKNYIREHPNSCGYRQSSRRSFILKSWKILWHCQNLVHPKVKTIIFPGGVMFQRSRSPCPAPTSAAVGLGTFPTPNHGLENRVRRIRDRLRANSAPDPVRQGQGKTKSSSRVVKQPFDLATTGSRTLGSNTKFQALLRTGPHRPGN